MKDITNKKRWRWALAVYLVFIGLVLWVAYQGRIPGWVAAIPNYDKVGHAVLMGALGLLLHRALGRPSLRVGPLSLPLGFALAAVLIAAEELAQFWAVYRNSSPVDYLADLIGLTIWWLVDIILNHLEHSNKHREEPS